MANLNRKRASENEWSDELLYVIYFHNLGGGKRFMTTGVLFWLLGPSALLLLSARRKIKQVLNKPPKVVK